ncbi:MAG: Hpt domain-containing protein [Nitrospirota bacterium]
MNDPVNGYFAAAETMPVWDEAKALAGVDGDRELLMELASVFITQAEADLETLRRAWFQQDADATAKAAHRLKGAVLQFAAARAHGACRRLEEAARCGNLSAAHSFWSETEAEVTALIRALVALRR